MFTDLPVKSVNVVNPENAVLLASLVPSVCPAQPVLLETRDRLANLDLADLVVLWDPRANPERRAMKETP